MPVITPNKICITLGKKKTIYPHQKIFPACHQEKENAITLGKFLLTFWFALKI
jgi:hypothetical protein